MAKAKGGLERAEESKSYYPYTQRVEIDGITSEMKCQVIFDRVKGNITISHQITTKQLSFDDQGKMVALEMAKIQLKTAYEHALELKREFLENKSNYDPDQGELPFGGDDDGAFVTFGLPGNAQED